MWRFVRSRHGLIVAGVAAGLFTARWLGELVPDALAIGVCMFAAGFLCGTAFFALFRRSG